MSRPQIVPGDVYPSLPLGACPACGEPVSLALDAAGEPLGMSHPLPMCETFDRMDPAEFFGLMRDVFVGGVGT